MNSSHIFRTVFGCSLLAGWLAGTRLEAGDWPQILGPNRNGVTVDEKPLRPFPATGPEKKWFAKIGSGFAGPAVAGQRVVVFHRLANAERLDCLDAGSGKPMWHIDFPAMYAGGVNPDNGPRCVPLIHGDRVYVYGAAGQLHCVGLADGKKVWSRDAYADFKGDEGYFGAGSTPIIAENKLLVNVGGKDAGIVAFDAANGTTLWKSLDERTSYSSPTTAKINGTTFAIFVTRLKCVAIDPTNGKVAFEFPFGRPGPTVNAATPLVFDNQLFVSSAYNVGARLSKLGVTPTELWSNDESMSSQYTTCVYRGGYLYGVHGREDFGNGELRCVEARSGKVAWTVAGFGIGHPILVGEQLLILTSTGELVLAAAKPDKYQELARASVASGVTRSLPAFSNGQFYFRDNNGDEGRLTCLTFEK